MPAPRWGKQELGRIPAGHVLILVGHGQAAQVGGCELAQAEVNEIHLERLGDLRHDAGLADARRGATS